jgi:1D-myo-inositol-triphosphate 3-kinase
LIDFAKTGTLPENIEITHKKNWEVGNHEDGYLIGLSNIIEIFEALQAQTNGNKNNSESDSE